ncbi:NAD-dependent epimerase/dehydratase family protein [Leptospira ilyithenensis]|uniref:NAD-dependent epimerase/dehydratase family protein n=1 Tax=Leptospira ilyithenensis TaxID=2484901 RepID=A0A4R9LMW8_9LEPT|nr:NAD-dependent epimerase/dehydratase family protein [Leptospira ilyithenensis]TGN08047.1 NAD-dependent epimerase/dehydratase family protein [Leptospira ilyithenensis]
MGVVIITGSAGLIGAESVRFFANKGYQIVGIDNDMRKDFFGEEASTHWQRKQLEESIPNYKHYSVDIRNQESIFPIFKEYNDDIELVIHAAAQPSHDWAAKDPFKDFTVNANGTLVLLEAVRLYSPKSVFIFTSTNKVYGDTPNYLPLVEMEKRWEIDEKHPYFRYGIDESMSIDQTKHSLFGSSKVAADVMVQEYGKYFGIKTGVFRGGCLTGPGHSGTALHGFLAYLMKCAITGQHYNVFGYKGKQVRDNIHSYDLVNMFYHFLKNPKAGEVYNAGGSRHSNCSMMEAIEQCEKITGKKMNYTYMEDNRIGDHIWYISDVRKFQKHYPDWKYNYDLNDILVQIYDATSLRV